MQVFVLTHDSINTNVNKSIKIITQLGSEQYNL